jgi:cell wall-associated NlpC family hydrolase
MDILKGLEDLKEELLNVPYLWGGKSSYGTDCSGLVQTIFRILGIPLLRDASQQVSQGITVNIMTESRTGDLLFFDNDEGEIVHTGIITGPGEILHASGCVKIDAIDHQGIYSKQLGKYTHKLRLIKRVL